MKSEKSKSKPAKKLDSRGLDAINIAEVDEKDDEPKVENWADKPDSASYIAAEKLYSPIQKCYDNKQQQGDSIEEFWNIYNAIPDENQQYSGNTTCYIPAVRDAINARVKRTLSQLFPANHKHVDCIGPTGDTPFPQLALMEHYIRKTNLKNIVRADLIAGDITGQWNLYVDWTKSYRTIKQTVHKPAIKVSDDDLEIEDPNDMIDDIEDTEIINEGPDIVAFATEDLAVYPPTVSDIEDSVASSIRLRMSKEKIEQLIEEGVFVGVSATEVVDRLGKDATAKDRKNGPKKRTNDAGIRTEGTYKYAMIYEVACNLPFEEDGRREPAYVYFAGQNEILGIIRNPQWSGKRPTISAGIDSITGSFFGISKIEPVKYLQWNLNDFWNMGMDSAQYALLPIIMTDPLKSPQWQSMVMGLAAVWLTDPNSTKPVSFPALYKDAIGLCDAIKRQIWESLDVNDAMMGKQPAGRKNQAAMGNMQQEQQTNIIDHAKRYEDMILNPLIERIFELDTQFRTEDLTIENRGDFGVKAMLQEIAPQQFGERYFFRWCGTSYLMGMQRMQQMISWMNVLRGIPPEQLNGRKLDITPILESGTEYIFGPEIGPRILIDDRNMFTIPPDTENEMMHNGLPTVVHAADDDMEHIQAHNSGAILSGDPHLTFRPHIMEHMKAMQAKMQAQQPKPKGQPGIPGGAGPGVAGTPRPGATPGQPRPQGPPGMIHPDQMQDAGAQPR